jgi:hypothetical protein
MARAPYDPKEAHAYYERTKHLTGRKKGAVKAAPAKPKQHAAAQARVVRLRGKVSKLKVALSEAEAALSKQRQGASKTEKASSDGKTTAKERQASKEYKDKHQTEIAAKSGSSSAAGSSSSGSSSKSSSSGDKSKGFIDDMNEQQLRARVTKIRGALRDAKRLLSNASQELGQLAHSAITSEPNVNEQFARFQSAERIPSK